MHSRPYKFTSFAFPGQDFTAFTLTNKSKKVWPAKKSLYRASCSNKKVEDIFPQAIKLEP
jgi:hypothetical protein